MLKLLVLLISVHLPIKPAFDIKLADDLKRYCPLTNFCENDEATSNEIQDGYEPCCRPCSCKADCGRKRNCCFSSLDTYRIDETLQTSCVTPVVDDNATLLLPSYHIVDKCPGSLATCKGKYPWGDMYPVYSQENELIYINEECAECHGIRNVKKWQVGFVCDKSESNVFSISNNIELALAGNSYGDNVCMMHFAPPADISLKSERCIAKDRIVNTCPKTANMPTEAEHYCQTYNATYSQARFDVGEVYANFHCYVCNNNYPTRFNKMCASDILETKTPTPQSIMVLFQVPPLGDERNHKDLSTVSMKAYVIAKKLMM